MRALAVRSAVIASLALVACAPAPPPASAATQLRTLTNARLSYLEAASKR